YLQVSLGVAGVTLYLLYVKTSRNSQRYKILLLNVVVSTTLMDIHLGVFFIPLPLIPFPGGYCIGLKMLFPSRLDRFQYFCATLACRCSMNNCFFFRHQAVLPSQSPLKLSTVWYLL
ncbi:hypothetical protein PMAYCL1PPCAC_13366, partial [Pristionchus mayeri]